MRELLFGLVLLVASFAVTAQDSSPSILPAEVNSGYDEWGPIASPDGKALYFTRLGHPQNMGDDDAADIWITYRNPNGQWPRAVNAGAPLNSRQDERVVGIHASGRKLYLYRPGGPTLYYSTRRGRVWQPPMPITIDSFSLQDRAARFAFSPDGKTLLLTFSGKGSMGGTDIYACFATEEGRFSSPRPLGPPANSSSDEVGLWLAADGEALYFSSNRPGGYGGQDLYLVRRLDSEWENWSLPQNLGPDINTPEDDLFLSMPASGTPVHLLRRSGEGSWDIYEAELPDSLLPQPVVLLTGTVRDAASGEAVSQASTRLYELRENAPAAPESIPGDEGGFQAILPQGHDFSLSAGLEGYFPISEPVVLSGKGLEELDQDDEGLLASLSRDPAYVQRNEEIMELQLHLREIDEELIRINEERKALRQKLQAARMSDPDWSPPSDPELDALRHRYQQYRSAARDTLIPEAYEEAESGAAELAGLKERYNRYVQYQKSQQKKAEEEAEAGDYLWAEARSFEQLQKEVRQGLKEALAPRVEQELSAGMLEEVKREVAASLDGQERQQLEVKEEDLRRSIRQSFGNPAGKPENWAAKGAAAETEWERQLKAGLRAAMEPEVREELRQALKEDIRAALANDVAYWAKKETQDGMQAQLNEKLQLQIEQERRKATAVPPGGDAVAPLEPAIAPEAQYREVQQDILLFRAEPGAVVPLNTVVFEPNKPTLKPVAYAELGQVLEFLRQNQQLVVEVGVHTGGQLSHSNALSLSTQRAKAIVNYLVGHGIDESRASARGYGKAFPVAEGNTPEAHRQNQRVEMRVISTVNNH